MSFTVIGLLKVTLLQNYLEKKIQEVFIYYTLNLKCIISLS